MFENRLKTGAIFFTALLASVGCTNRQNISESDISESGKPATVAKSNNDNSDGGFSTLSFNNSSPSLEPDTNLGAKIISLTPGERMLIEATNYDLLAKNLTEIEGSTFTDLVSVPGFDLDRFKLCLNNIDVIIKICDDIIKINENKNKPMLTKEDLSVLDSYLRFALLVKNGCKFNSRFSLSDSTQEKIEKMVKIRLSIVPKEKAMIERGYEISPNQVLSSALKVKTPQSPQSNDGVLFISHTNKENTFKQGHVHISNYLVNLVNRDVRAGRNGPTMCELARLGESYDRYDYDNSNRKKYPQDSEDFDKNVVAALEAYIGDDILDGDFFLARAVGSLASYIPGSFTSDWVVEGYYPSPESLALFNIAAHVRLGDTNTVLQSENKGDIFISAKKVEGAFRRGDVYISNEIVNFLTDTTMDRVGSGYMLSTIAKLSKPTFLYESWSGSEYEEKIQKSSKGMFEKGGRFDTHVKTALEKYKFTDEEIEKAKTDLNFSIIAEIEELEERGLSYSDIESGDESLGRAIAMLNRTDSKRGYMPSAESLELIGIVFRLRMSSDIEFYRFLKQGL